MDSVPYRLGAAVRKMVRRERYPVVVLKTVIEPAEAFSGRNDDWH